MTLLVALLASTLFISNAMKSEYNTIINSYPDIVITNQKALRDTTIDEDEAYKVLSIKGVSSVVPRVWGHYYFLNADTKFLIFGRDKFETYSNPLLNASSNITKDSMLISQGVKKSLHESYYDEYFNFIKADGSIKKLTIKATLKQSNSLENSSLIIMNTDSAKEIFQYKDNEVTDLGVSVANENEVAFVAGKIETLFPMARVSVKDDLRVKYENIYNLRSGFFLNIFTITFFTFFIIIYDKVSGLNSEQRREIGILKALGWRVGDILNARLYEGVIISLLSYTLGITMAFIYVNLFNAPYLKDIFLNNYDLMHDFRIVFSIDYETLALIFFLSVPIYIAATVIPSWRVATLEADEVMR
jgi:ABC-type lipoprotein release transport system permease subunit